jgi:hypothetical protein
MKKTFGDYRHLAGGMLWEGPDHLLYIESSGFFLSFSESYRRIDFKNIQALSLVKTSRYAWISLLLVVCTVMTGLPLLSSDLPTAGIVSFGIGAAVFALLLIYHLAKGPTSNFTLRTAVQTLRLKSVRRMKLGREAMVRIAELCDLHQASLVQAEAAAFSSVEATPTSYAA